MSKLINLVLLTVCTVTLAVGQVLFKSVGLSIRGKSLPEALLILPRQPVLYGALAVYAMATILWIWILARVPLAQAYPWVGVGLLVVPLLGAYWFGERVTPVYWLGACLIAVGIVLTQMSAQSPADP